MFNVPLNKSPRSFGIAAIEKTFDIKILWENEKTFTQFFMTFLMDTNYFPRRK